MAKKQPKEVDVIVHTPQGDVKETLTEKVNDTVFDDESIIDPATLTDEEKENAIDGNWVVEKISPYLDAYPNEKEFHLASDGQVFLGNNLAFAKEHQRSLKDGKEVVSFTVDKTP